MHSPNPASPAIPAQQAASSPLAASSPRKSRTRRRLAREVAFATWLSSGSVQKAAQAAGVTESAVAKWRTRFNWIRRGEQVAALLTPEHNTALQAVLASSYSATAAGVNLGLGKALDAVLEKLNTAQPDTADLSRLIRALQDIQKAQGLLSGRATSSSAAPMAVQVNVLVGDMPARRGTAPLRTVDVSQPASESPEGIS